jgi:hypothetical protein
MQGLTGQAVAPAAHGVNAHRSSYQMQRAKDFVVRARFAKGVWRVHTVVALLCSLTACGEERPPWAGFPLFSPDASTFELPPELASSFNAAEIAFVTQLAAEQAARTAGAAGGSSANSEGAGAMAASPMAAMQERAPASGAKADKPRQPAALDAGVAIPATVAGHAAIAVPPNQPAMPPQPNTRAPMPAADAGRPHEPPATEPSPPDAGAAPSTDAGGQVPPIDPPTQPSQPDAGPPEPDADAGA